MKVAELQRLLANITPFVRAAGGSEKVAAEFDRALQCLEPFKEKTLAEFNDFLGRADEFDRTGKLTAPARSGKARSPKTPSMTVDEAVQIYRDLHARATEATLSYPDIDATMQAFDKLSMPQLKDVAAQVGAVVPAKPKAKIMEALTRRIKELKASGERTQFRLGETA